MGASLAVTVDNRLSRMLHMLIHIDLHDGAATSETLSKMLGTNPVVVRRMMAGLRDGGYVRATKGPGGGWQLARAPEDISILDVHRALGEPALLATAIHEDHPGCPVERSVNATLAAVLNSAEAAILARYRGITLADIAGSIKTD